MPWQASVLLAWDAVALLFLVRVVRLVVGNADVATVASHDDPNRLLRNVLLVIASVGCLAGVVLAIVKAKQADPTSAALIVLAIVSVLLSWTVLHSVYVLHYAHLYFTGSVGGIDFGAQAPTYADFAYLAFTVGMTFQVSDTPFTTPEMRHHALPHAVLSFFFGTFILATTMNVLAGFLS
ncbi:MAG: hypothetical protein QOD30_2097 [Actinomycetota bacterium]|jgi:uncharacterized membrane protein|nr:hypothetical protein [Actinomycetota bacterium]